MIAVALFSGGFISGAACLFILLLVFQGTSTWKPSNPQDAGDIIMAISADIQAQLDRLAPVPALIKQAVANAEADTQAAAAAAAQAAQDHVDEIAALTAKVDPIIAAVTPATADTNTPAG